VADGGWHGIVGLWIATVRIKVLCYVPAWRSPIPTQPQLISSSSSRDSVAVQEYRAQKYSGIWDKFR